MKKLFLFSALAAAIGLASCTSDELAVGTDGQEVTVKYSIALPAQLQSRAYGDAAQVTDLYYAVYATGDATTVLFEDKVAGAFGGSDLTEDVTLNLVTGKSYDIVFWADAAGSPYTYDKATQCIKVDYSTAKNGQEARDAFFGQVVDMKITGPVNKTVELRRPFAQLNIGTDDLAMVAPAVTKAEVKVPVYDQVNLLNGAVSNQDGTTDPKVVTFALDAFPTEAFPVTHADASKTYKYMAMNYLLVNTRELVKVEMTTDDTTVDALVYDNVPVQRNYRTNIYGSLLTSPTKFTVIIKPEFNKPDYEHFVAVATPAELISAFNNGETAFVLTDDIDLSSEPALPYGLLANGNDLVVDLNDNILTMGGNRIYANGSAGNVDIMNGTVVVSSQTGLYTTNGGSINVDNATIEGTSQYPIYTNGSGDVKVTNSTIKVGGTSGKSIAAVARGGSVEMENVTIEGGMIASSNAKTAAASVKLTNVTAVVENGVQTEYGGKIELEGCNITVNKPETRNVVCGVTVFDQCDVVVKNTTINCAKGYGFSTNASNPLAVNALIENCNIDAKNAIMMNEPGVMVVKDTKLVGAEHTVIARGGTITFDNCDMTLNGDSLFPTEAAAQLEYDQFTGDNLWESGTSVPNAVITIGNHTDSSYRYPTNVTFTGTNSLKVEGVVATVFPVIYAHANAEDGMGVTFTYPVGTTIFTGLAPVYVPGNMVVNGNPILP